jgi:hypothetical protein
MSRARRIYEPQRVKAKADSAGTPLVIGGVGVEAIREDWVVEDRWWTGRPLHRRYYEVVLVNGRGVVVFRDVESGRWYRQSA